MRKFMFGYLVGSIVSLITASYIWNFDILVKKPKLDRKYASITYVDKDVKKMFNRGI